MLIGATLEIDLSGCYWRLIPEYGRRFLTGRPKPLLPASVPGRGEPLIVTNGTGPVVG